MTTQTNSHTAPVDERAKRHASAFVARMAQFMDAVMLSHEPPLPDVELSPRGVKALTSLGDRGSMTMTELAAAVQVPLSTATRIVDRLVAKGLVERTRSEQDRRVVVIAPSEQGNAMHTSLRTHQEAVAYRMLEHLSVGEREILIELVGKLLAAAKLL